MDLSIYQVIKGPLMTTKAYALNQELSQLVLEVHPHANKALIAQALKKLFNVVPSSVRVSVRKGKVRRSGRHVVIGKLRKKAIVTLQKGQSINLNEWDPASVKKAS